MIISLPAIIPLQHGTNKFATQKGVKIGASRDITPKVKDISHKDTMKQWSEQQLRASDGKFGTASKIIVNIAPARLTVLSILHAGLDAP